MWKTLTIHVVQVILLLSVALEIKACTTLLCGRMATADGSVMASHSSDGGGTLDPRLVHIPARDHSEGALRPVYSSPEIYPRYTGTERGAPEYFPENCQSIPEVCAAMLPIGYIPQVSHTHSYFESTYGIMNEHQVALAESTCSGVFSTTSVANGGSALLSIDQLSHIAMERASTSREAVTLMGKLAEEYGFYGESDSFEGGAESLMVSDPTEGFIFHILPDPSGISAIWVAQRVPDDECTVVANMFVVREVNLSDTFHFLGSANMWDIAEEQGLWKKGQPQDFTGTFSDGEYSHKYYSGRRMWGAYRLLSPQISMSPWYNNLKDDRPYPVTAPVQSRLIPRDLFGVHRDWYNGTGFDPSEPGILAGGAFGTPDRYGGGEGEEKVEGAWERTIALYRTSSSFVVQSRNWLPREVGGIIWFGAYAPHGTCYVPILPGSMTLSPTPLSHVYQGVLDKDTNFWAHRMVMNIAQVKFKYIIVDIQDKQQELEISSQQLVDEISSKYATMDLSHIDTKNEITKILSNNVINVRDSFLDLFEMLLFKYADGWVNSWTDKGFSSVNTGYPAWWLEKVGYAAGPKQASFSEKHDDKWKESVPLDQCLATCLDHNKGEETKEETVLKQCTNCCIQCNRPC